MPLPEHDLSEWPIVVVTWPKGKITDSEFPVYLDNLSAHHGHGGRFARVMDVRASGALSAHERRQLAERLDSDEAKYPGQLVAMAVVTSTIFQRGIFKALAWLYSKPQRREAFSNLEDAKRWAWMQLAGRDTSVPQQDLSGQR